MVFRCHSNLYNVSQYNAAQDAACLMFCRADVMLPGPLQCPEVYEKMLVAIVRTFDTEYLLLCCRFYT